MRDHMIVGSRESRLAVVQAMTVVDYIRGRYPQAEVSLLTMKTTGDKILDRTLDQVGGKGLFVKELDQALRDKRVDITVHSLKDMPMALAEDLPLIAFSSREDVRDVLVLPPGRTEPDPKLPIGTSSLRRSIQLRRIFPEWQLSPVRGNLQTRLRKLDEGQYSGLVLAAAGLKRLGLQDRISRYFEPDELLPAAGQGILAVQGRAGEDYGMLEGFNDLQSFWAASAERAFVATLDGGCTSPVCAFARIEGDMLTLRGLYYEENMTGFEIDTITGPASSAGRLTCAAQSFRW